MDTLCFVSFYVCVPFHTMLFSLKSMYIVHIHMVGSIQNICGAYMSNSCIGLCRSSLTHYHTSVVIPFALWRRFESHYSDYSGSVKRKPHAFHTEVRLQ
jgi:hypothetical protein